MLKDFKESLKLPNIVIYDPNHLNSYGSELAGIFMEGGRSVRHYISEQRSLGLKEAPASDRVLLPGVFSHRSRTLRHLFRRVVTPIEVAFSQGRKRPIVVVWTRDPWDTMCMIGRTLFGGLIYFVYHNPPSVRRRRGLAGFLEMQLSKRSHVIVHSEWLANCLPPGVKTHTVLPHPPYSAVARYSRIMEVNSTETSAVPSVAFIGALRADKGVADLPKISRSSNAKWRLVVVGDPDGIAELKLSMPSGSDRQVVPAVYGRPPSDDEMVEALKKCTVVIAPYRQVSESGSIHFAYALASQVLAYDSEGTRLLLAKKSRVSGPEQLGRLIDDYMRSPWETFNHSFSSTESNASKAWLTTIVGEQ